MIVISLIAVLATAGIYLINPMNQIQKGWDSQRKNDMATTKKVLEDFYNDKQCYPLPSEICYDASSAIELSDGSYICHICGNDSSSPSLSPYINKILCDPQQSTKPYLYHAENNSCPQTYEIYTKLSYIEDPAIAEVGCEDGCGVNSSPADYTYNYCVSSPNEKCGVLELPPCSEATSLFMQSAPGRCDVCTPNDHSCTYTRRVDSTCYDRCRW